jgi:nucleoside-diphosphate-sugar epimerase
MLILGCGYVGSALAAEGLRRGFEVHALTRNPDTAGALAGSGVRVVQGDIASQDWHARMPAEADLVVNCVSSGRGGVEAYRHAFVDGQRSVAAFVRASGAACIVYTSSTSVYLQTGGVTVSEDDAARRGDPGLPWSVEALLDAERELLDAGLGLAVRVFILRLAGIYGPGRHLLLDQVAAGQTLPGDAARHLNLIHRDDVVAAILAAHASTSRGDLFNISDDAPARGVKSSSGWPNDWVSRYPRSIPASTPAAPPAAPRARRCRTAASPTRARAANWVGVPMFPSFREGYEAILRERK